MVVGSWSCHNLTSINFRLKCWVVYCKVLSREVGVMVRMPCLSMMTHLHRHSHVGIVFLEWYNNILCICHIALLCPVVRMLLRLMVVHMEKRWRHV